MNRYRNAFWFPCLSILLVAVFVQAQVSGCCKLGSWFRGAIADGAAQASAGGSVPAADGSDAANASAPEHACCPKKEQSAQASAQAVPPAPGAPIASAVPSHACAASDHGCCLQGSDLNAEGLVSIAGGPSFDAALPLPARILGRLPAVADLSRAGFARMDPGPTETRLHLPLLI